MSSKIRDTGHLLDGVSHHMDSHHEEGILLTILPRMTLQGVPARTRQCAGRMSLTRFELLCFSVFTNRVEENSSSEPWGREAIAAGQIPKFLSCFFMVVFDLGCMDVAFNLC